MSNYRDILSIINEKDVIILCKKCFGYRKE